VFRFEHLWLFSLLPLPLLWRYLMRPGELQWRGALQIPFFSQLKSALQVSGVNSNSRWHLFGLLLIWCLLITATAKPVWYGEPIVLDREARNIMLAVDLSDSMKIQDMQWTSQSADRLFVVKKLAKQFIDNREGDRLGLILFGTRAYLQTPLTFDRQTVWAMLDDASVGLAGRRTAIGDAIGLAIKRLQRYPAKSRVLVLLTDGANNTGHVSPEAAAKMAAKYGIKIYTIGLGAEHMTVAGFFHQDVINPSADLDERVLKKIATLTKAKYFRARSTVELQQVYRSLDELEPVIADKSVFRPEINLYPWFLIVAFGLGILLLLPLLIRRRVCLP